MENRAAIQSDISTVVSCMKGRMLYSAYGIIQNNDTLSAKNGEQNPMFWFVFLKQRVKQVFYCEKRPKQTSD